jgi:hypothetical protein
MFAADYPLFRYERLFAEGTGFEPSVRVTLPKFRENRHEDDAGHPSRDRWFESISLQRGVRNELLIDAAPFAGSASLT